MTEKILYTAKGDDCWGNAIVWDKDDLVKVTKEGDIVKFHGWKQRRPEIGDYIQIAMKTDKHFLFEVTESEHLRDPNDMFFCKV